MGGLGGSDGGWDGGRESCVCVLRSAVGLLGNALYASAFS